MTTIEPPPINATERLERATRELANEKQAGIKAMTIACGEEFKPPVDLAGAANIIASLRQQRDRAKNTVISANETTSQAAKDIAGDVQSALKGDAVRNPQLTPLSLRIKSLEQTIAQQNERDNQFRENVRHCLIDAKMQEIAGLTGYFTGATPMLRAAEAAVILAHYLHDRVAREGYLRSRGWRMTGNGWTTPDGATLQGTMPVEAAVIVQAKLDAQPFVQQAAKLKEVRPVDATLSNADARNPNAKTAFTEEREL